MKKSVLICLAAVSILVLSGCNSNNKKEGVDKSVVEDNVEENVKSDENDKLNYWITKEDETKYFRVNSDGEIREDKDFRNYGESDIIIIYNKDYYESYTGEHEVIKYEEYTKSVEDFDSSTIKEVSYFSVEDINNTLKEAGSKAKIKDYSDLTFYKDISGGFIKDGDSLYQVAVDYAIPDSNSSVPLIKKIKTYRNGEDCLKYPEKKISTEEIKGVWKSSSYETISIEDGTAYSISDNTIGRAQMKSFNAEPYSLLYNEDYWKTLEKFVKAGYLLDSRTTGMVFSSDVLENCIFMDEDTIVEIDMNGEENTLKKVSSKVENVRIDGDISLNTAKALFSFMDENEPYYACQVSQGNETDFTEYTDFNVNLAETPAYFDNNSEYLTLYRVNSDSNDGFEIVKRN